MSGFVQAGAVRSGWLVWGVGVPLLIVGGVAMAISYVTLIDVAASGGIPFPVLFPVVVDAGMVAAMVAAAQFRVYGLRGCWLAYATFGVLSVVSVAANAFHAARAADVTVIPVVAAGVLAGIPPAVLIAVTHLVMMLLPVRQAGLRRDVVRDRRQAGGAGTAGVTQSGQDVVRDRGVVSGRDDVGSGVQDELSELVPGVGDAAAGVARLRVVPAVVSGGGVAGVDGEVADRVFAWMREHGSKPTGVQVGVWLGKSAKSGQRFLARLTDGGRLPGGVGAGADGGGETGGVVRRVGGGV